MSASALRNLPSVNDLLEAPPVKDAVAAVGRAAAVAHLRILLAELRSDLRAQGDGAKVPPAAELADRFSRQILQADRPKLRSVINATGILLHTGLGRAPLAEEAIEALAAVSRDYASVELDLSTGLRSHRVDAVSGLMSEITGAEAAVVVNNCAAATVLTLTALASGREVIVSRGQLIEIGGSFRLPEVMAASGAILREVGTTNKTRLDDYARAIGDQTAALLLVHPSNYVVWGFTETVELEDLVALARTRGLPLIHDIGSGALVDFAEFGLAGEPLARVSLAAGADLVLFSGDKLLGGPQCGIVAGRSALVEKVARHPLARALRVDKLTLAALAATLRLYRVPAAARQRIPLLALVSTSPEELKRRARRLASQLASCAGLASVEPTADTCYLGGGSAPGMGLPTWCVAVTPSNGRFEALAARLRDGTPAVVARVQHDRLLLDLRTVFPRQDPILVEAVRSAAGN